VDECQPLPVGALPLQAQLHQKVPALVWTTAITTAIGVVTNVILWFVRGEVISAGSRVAGGGGLARQDARHAVLDAVQRVLGGLRHFDSPRCSGAS
jgi:hypothetical protein